MISNEPPHDTAAVVSRHRALAILRILVSRDLQGKANDHFLSTLLHELALGGSREKIRACLQKLEDSGLVTTAPAPDRELLVISLTAQGADVAEGRAPAYGVEPFFPGCPY